MFKFFEKIDQLLGTLEVTERNYTIDEDSLQFFARIVHQAETNQSTPMTPAYAETKLNIKINKNSKCSTSHQSESHSMNGKKIGQSLHKCCICNECFASRSYLYDHMNSHTKEIEFECGICSMLFSKLGDVHRHVKRGHKKKPLALKSPNMNAQVQSVKKLSKHRCFICSKYYSYMYLSTHINGVHTKEISYKCSFCPKMFNYRTSLDRHTKSVHTKPLTE